LGARGRRADGPETGDQATAVDVVTDCGYEPHVDGEGITLGNCPFHALAEDYRDLVCGMNLDLMTGLLEGLEATSKGEEREGHSRLEARLEPSPGRCCVRLVRT